MLRVADSNASCVGEFQECTCIIASVVGTSVEFVYIYIFLRHRSNISAHRAALSLLLLLLADPGGGRATEPDGGVDMPYSRAGIVPSFDRVVSCRRTNSRALSRAVLSSQRCLLCQRCERLNAERLSPSVCPFVRPSVRSSPSPSGYVSPARPRVLAHAPPSLAVAGLLPCMRRGLVGGMATVAFVTIAAVNDIKMAGLAQIRSVVHPRTCTHARSHARSPNPISPVAATARRAHLRRRDTRGAGRR